MAQTVKTLPAMQKTWVQFKFGNISKGLEIKNNFFSKKKKKAELSLDFPGGSGGKESANNAEDLGSIPGSRRSPREGNGNPFQYPRLENSMDRETNWLQSMGSQGVGHI